MGRPFPFLLNSLSLPLPLPLLCFLSPMFLKTLTLFAILRATTAASADQWRGRSIYQIITDRFALPAGANTNVCNPGDQTWCGGTWKTIQDNLDYVQDAGFTAIWISPINQNYQGPRSAYGDPYHGYWSADVSQLNERFGSADDLKALIAEVHRRNMYVMVDVVVNNVMSTSLTPNYSTYMLNDKSYYHPYCPIQWGNTTSEQNCWLGDTNVPLPDLDTRNPTVISRYGDWIEGLVKDYSIDGLRIDAAKHVNMDFWPGFAAKAGVFCIGEVFGGLEVDDVAQYQGPQGLDSVLNYPLYSALSAAFAIPGPQNMTALTTVMQDSKTQFKDVTLLGNFLENQDLPRWHNQSTDPQTLYNAMVLTFMTDGIPIVYYGQEQGFSGATDPWNREPMWPSQYAKTDAYKLIQRLNSLRNYLVNSTDWLQQDSQISAVNNNSIAITKGSIISIVTNIGSPPQNNVTIAVRTGFKTGTPTTNIVNCQEWVVGSGSMVEVEYTKGGEAVVLLPSSQLKASGLCGTDGSDSNPASVIKSSATLQNVSRTYGLVFILVVSGYLLEHFL
ncbi:glycoside hydrolase family 13 protein [Pluteus cervinus]|uniref:Glycoside hydrolase family 13 protein n=1 Tax=Pluteus cervinus TaxID=181527 RepID=A0ACD3APM5_9AGAR|nr:glycoside hydrolase family 13 protein [Pluteus cervinus]